MRNLQVNKHIELVKKWLDDPDSVTKEELKANADAYAADAYAAYYAAYNAAYYAYAADADDAYAEYAAECVKRYEKLTGQKDNE